MVVSNSSHDPGDATSHSYLVLQVTRALADGDPNENLVYHQPSSNIWMMRGKFAGLRAEMVRS